MSQAVKIAYLEISPRQTGKTTRLADMASNLVAQGKQVVFVMSNPGLVKEWSHRHPALTVILDGQEPPAEIDPDRVVWFYDEFDWLKSTVIREGAYYATTAARLRLLGRDRPENDLLMRLVQAYGDRHERYLWSFDMSDCISANRLSMSADCFRRSMLGEFLS